ncbi:MAG: prolyl oligopeptidase family serine peptidase [Proteobacteria bacterium]|nr:prolyl oligopeptidase family serine peptidase [Pseudomonadota bacterium]
MARFFRPLGIIVITGWLAACGSSTPTSAVSTDVTAGALIVNPPLRIASVDAATFAAQLGASTSGAQLLQLAGTPTCGVDFYYIKYRTKGGANERTTASGAMMVPTGSASACSGGRPIVLYAHGTATDKNYNIADITNTANTEGALVAAVFAAQGYIVVAPNYAGYDDSTLSYHPYLNAQQQSGEMLDALAAARAALPNTFSSATTDGGKLFVTGYSQGGYVAMATVRALQAAGKSATASAPMSGPYALEAFTDAIFYGKVDLGATVFSPLLAESYQKAYGNIYSAPSDLFSATYATGIDTLLPSTESLEAIFSENKLPLTQLFDSTTPVTGNAALDAALAVPNDPLFSLGFGDPYLVNNDYRLSYVLDAVADPDGAVPTPSAGVPLAAEPQQPLRHAVWTNDLRNGNWAPASPTLMCGGAQDPTVFFSVNTGTMQAFWSTLPAGLLTVLDVHGTPAGPFAQLQGAFQQSQAQELAFLQTAAGGSLTQAQAEAVLVQNYHTAVAPFCTVAARGFFAAF